MTLSQEDLFKLALNLQDPWYIKSIEFSNTKKQIDIHIDFILGSRFECSNCKFPNNCIHDTSYLSLAEKENLGSLKDMNLITAKAYNFKLSLKDFWKFNDKILAEDFLKKLYYWATHSQIEPIIDAAKTLKSHWNGIINYAETKISNGVLEGINSMVQSARSSARGFKQRRISY